MPPKVQIRKHKLIYGMNSYEDSTTLQEGVFHLVQNMRPDKNALFTREGRTKYNSTELPGSAGVYGLAPYSPNSSLSLVMAISNGKAYSGNAGTFTERIGAGYINSSSLCQMVQYDDAIIIVDGVNRPIVYRYGKSPDVFTLGLESPKEWKLIEGFETSAATWTCTNGSAYEDYWHQVQGTQCIRFLTTTGTVMTAYKVITTVDCTVFPSGGTSTVSDYISFLLIREDYSAFDSCTLRLGDATLTNYFSIVLSSRSEWTITSAPEFAIDFKIRKSAFSSTGSPNWNAISRVQFELDAATGKQASITVDYLRLEKTGPIPAAGSVGNLLGTYYYRVTYESWDGWESDSSVVSDLVTVSSKQVDLTNIPVATSTRISKKNIYRIGGTSAEWRLVAVLADKSVTTYTDNLAEANLGDLYDQVEGIPDIPKCIAVHGNKVILANMTSIDGTTYPCGVMVSLEGSMDIYDALDFFEVEKNFNAIVWLVSALDFIFVGKYDSIWKFDPDDLTIPPRNVSGIYGAVGPLAACAGENEFYFLDRSGVISYNNSFFDRVSDTNPMRGRFTGVKDYIDQIPDAYLWNCWMIYADKTLLVGIPYGGTSYPSLILAYYVPKQSWTVHTGWPARCAYVNVGVLRMGAPTRGFVYTGLDGDTDEQDDGPALDITSIVQTGDDDFDNPEIRKDYYKAFLWGNKLTTSNVPLTIQPYIDTSDSGIILDTTITTIDSAANKKLEMPVPQLSYLGTYLGLKITATKRWSLRNLVLFARMMEPT